MKLMSLRMTYFCLIISKCISVASVQQTAALHSWRRLDYNCRQATDRRTTTSTAQGYQSSKIRSLKHINNSILCSLKATATQIYWARTVSWQKIYFLEVTCRLQRFAFMCKILLLWYWVHGKVGNSRRSPSPNSRQEHSTLHTPDITIW